MTTFRIFLNKKSEVSARKIIFYGVACFVIVAAFFLIVWISYSGKSKINEIPSGLENYILAQRFLRSPVCFTLKDKDTNRAYPMAIDLEKFNQANLDNCYNAEGTQVKAYRLTLDYSGTKININTRNWEGFLKKAETKKILLYDHGKIQMAELFVEAQDAK